MKKILLIIFLIILSAATLKCKRKDSDEPKAENTYQNIFEAIIKGNAQDVNDFLKTTQVNIAEKQTKQTPLHFAAAYGKLDIVKLLIDKGADVNVRNRIGGTPLFASTMGRDDFLEVAKLLIEKGADVNAQAENGSSILHFAVLNGQPQMVRLLLSKGADPTKRNNNGQTPLDLADKLSTTKLRNGSRKEAFEECLKILRE